jgi:hypothetical protein
LHINKSKKQSPKKLGQKKYEISNILTCFQIIQIDDYNFSPFSHTLVNDTISGFYFQLSWSTQSRQHFQSAYPVHPTSNSNTATTGRGWLSSIRQMKTLGLRALKLSTLSNITQIGNSRARIWIHMNLRMLFLIHSSVSVFRAIKTILVIYWFFSIMTHWRKKILLLSGVTAIFRRERKMIECILL